MRTRLTERLGIEQPVMLAGTGADSALQTLVPAGDLVEGSVDEAPRALRGSAARAGVS